MCFDSSCTCVPRYVDASDKKCRPCAVGKELNATGNGCATCQRGYFRDRDLVAKARPCQRCEEGKEQIPGAASCIDCRNGAVSSVDTNVTCQACPLHSEPDETGRTCVSCPVGRAWAARDADNNTGSKACEPRTTLLSLDAACGPTSWGADSGWLARSRQAKRCPRMRNTRGEGVNTIHGSSIKKHVE